MPTVSDFSRVCCRGDKFTEMMDCESQSTSSGIGTGHCSTSSKHMSLKELNRALNGTVESYAELKRKKNTASRSEASWKVRRESDRIANQSESQRERRKLVYDACNGKRKRKHTEVEINDGGNDVNVDAERFRTAFDAATKFHVCAVCGTDECLENLRELNTECVAMVEASNLPVLYSTVVNSLRGGDALYDEYVRNIETEFNSNGLLRDARYLCIDCAAVLKKGRTAKKTRAASSNGSSSSSGMVGDDEFVDVVDSAAHTDATTLANQAANVPVNVPRTAFLLGLYPGIIPAELRDLRQVEISMISIYNPVTRIKLNSKGMSFKYFHGSAHTYTVVNDVSAVASHLPWVPNINTLAILKYKSEVCVKELKYRPYVVRRALTWLKEHNHLYKSVSIEYPREWAGMNEECELEPESMVVDEMEEETVRQMEKMSGDTTEVTGAANDVDDGGK